MKVTHLQIIQKVATKFIQFTMKVYLVRINSKTLKTFVWNFLGLIITVWNIYCDWPQLKNWFFFQSVALLLSLAVLSESLPQYNTAWGGDSSGSSGGGGYPEQGSQTGSNPGPSVQCQYQEGSDGKLTYNCEGVSTNQITLSNEHILWLHGPQAKDQELHVT